MHKIQLLEDYKKYLCLPGKVPDYHKPHYIIWIEKFLMNLEENQIHKKLKYSQIQNFILGLARDQRYEHWQIRQAVDAIHIFVTMLSEQNK